MENPHTSASTTATLRPRAASDTARLVVTEDLPTPPLPEAISSERVRQPGSANGMVLPSAWPWAGWEPAVAAGSPMSLERRAVLCASLMTPSSTRTSRTPGSALTASVTRLVISARMGQPATVSATSTSTTPRGETRTSPTMSNSTMLRCSSGSSTPSRASRICSFVGTFEPGTGDLQRRRRRRRRRYGQATGACRIRRCPGGGRVPLCSSTQGESRPSPAPTLRCCCGPPRSIVVRAGRGDERGRRS